MLAEQHCLLPATQLLFRLQWDNPACACAKGQQAYSRSAVVLCCCSLQRTSDELTLYVQLLAINV
jgi:hypothetical protein